MEFGCITLCANPQAFQPQSVNSGFHRSIISSSKVKLICQGQNAACAFQSNKLVIYGQTLTANAVASECHRSLLRRDRLMHSHLLLGQYKPPTCVEYIKSDYSLMGGWGLHD